MGNAKRFEGLNDYIEKYKARKRDNMRCDEPIGPQSYNIKFIAKKHASCVLMKTGR